MSWKFVPWHSDFPASNGTVKFTTIIARMLGKAVKVRHCPATVSAPALDTVE